MKKKSIILMSIIGIACHNSIHPGKSARTKTTVPVHAVLKQPKTNMSQTEQGIHKVMKSHSNTLKNLSLSGLKQHKPKVEQARKSLLGVLQDADPIEREAHAELEHLLKTLNLDEIIDFREKFQLTMSKLHPETQALVKSLLPALTRLALGV